MTYLTVEGSRGKQIGIARTPVSLEGPIGVLRDLTEKFTGLRIPA
jgi:hypothetical protein